MSENLPAVATGHTTGTSIDNKIAGISGSRAMFATSFNTDDRAGQVKLIGAIGEAEPIDEYLGETIMLTDYVARSLSSSTRMAKCRRVCASFSSTPKASRMRLCRTV